MKTKSKFAPSRQLFWLHWMTVISMLAAAHEAPAFEVFSFISDGETLYLKWGDNHAGTPGGTVTWSLIPAGTAGDPAFCGDKCPGIGSDELQVEIAPSMGFAPRSLASLVPEIESTLARWAAVTGIRFIRLENDSGLPLNDPAAVPPLAGDIRIGVFAFAAGGGAVGFAPPPNGGTGAGDILFDSGSFYQFAPGNEGDPFATTFAPNDFPGLLLHELGHAAVGLAHPPFDGTCPVMQIDPACLGIINRELDRDDLDGAGFLYGGVLSDSFESL